VTRGSKENGEGQYLEGSMVMILETRSAMAAGLFSDYRRIKLISTVPRRRKETIRRGYMCSPDWQTMSRVIGDQGRGGCQRKKRRANLGTRLLEGIDGGSVQVIDNHFVAGLEEIACHVGPHVAETDEADGGGGSRAHVAHC
jgi:hypothetical protein